MNPVLVVFDIDGVIRDVGGSYRRALADTVEQFTAGAFRPSQDDIDALKSEGLWNNDWEASRELIYRYYEAHPDAALPTAPLQATWREAGGRAAVGIDYDKLVAFFQARYRGPDPVHWTGYICEEPLLLLSSYLELLSDAGIRWGFFSGATRGSARYVLEKRLGLRDPVLVAMEDAPGKPDPTGLLKTVGLLEVGGANTPVIYVGDTVADMYTVMRAREVEPARQWSAVGVLPPHVQTSDEHSRRYMVALEQAGANIVFWNVQELTPERIEKLVRQ